MFQKVPLCRTVASAILLALVMAIFPFTATADPVFLRTISEPGDMIGGGGDTTTSAVTASNVNGRAGVLFTAGGMEYRFESGTGDAIVSGTYQPVARYPFYPEGIHGMYVVPTGVYEPCINGVTGYYIVHELVFGADNSVQRAAIDFEQRCFTGSTFTGYDPGKLYGFVRYNSTVPIADQDADGVPDIQDNCPAIANAGQADSDGDRTGDACDSINGITYIALDSDAGDEVGQGQQYLFTRSQGGVDMLQYRHVASSYAELAAGGFIYQFDASKTATLAVGAYENAIMWPSSSSANRSVIGMNVYGNGRGCNPLTGRFDVLELERDSDGIIRRFAANFEQHCSGSVPALRGRIRFHAETLGGDEFDSDGDRFLDVEDNCPQAANPGQEDADGDGVGDLCDLYPTDPAESADLDGDSLPDNTDTDDDGDGVADIDDDFPRDPLESRDTDGDGIGDNADTDDDNDGIDDGADSCPLNADPSQSDYDADGLPDACADNDDDNDGVADALDRWPLDATEAYDNDGDGIGDNADTDDDNDGIADVADNCPMVANPTQADTDSDGLPDLCGDTDNDNDGTADDEDAFPLVNAVSVDDDGDGVPDVWNAACNVVCQNTSGVTLDNCPLLPNTDQLDTDADGLGDACDLDDDNDGVADILDSWPLDPAQSQDADFDGIGDDVDSDDDNDGYPDTSDAFPLEGGSAFDSDGDGLPDSIDTSFHVEDFEGNGFAARPWQTSIVAPWSITASTSHSGTYSVQSGAISHNQSTVLQVAQRTGVSISFWFRTSSEQDYDTLQFYIDGVLAGSWSGKHSWRQYTQAVTPGSHHLAWVYVKDNAQSAWSDTVWLDDIDFGTTLVEDTDDDNDGVADAADAFPKDPSETVDSDGDGIGNNSDTDDDNDGTPDTDDVFPQDASEQQDSDGDGIGDHADQDDDGDVFSDDMDNCPLVNNPSQADTDGDGAGDACDTDDDDDGVADLVDNCPLVSNPQQADFDSDGVGNACGDEAPLPTDNAGVAAGDSSGTAVAFAGDVNRDGYGDIVVGEPGHDVGTNKDAGRARVLSGHDGSVLMSVDGVSRKDAMGVAVAGNADIDNDGYPDVLVGALLADGAVKDSGTVTILYGPDGARRELLKGAVSKSWFGAAIALGDVDADGHADILVGAPRDDESAHRLVDAGSVSVISGADLHLLQRYYGKTAKANAGAAVAAGDVDGVDGVDGDEIVIGAPLDDMPGIPDVGSVSVYRLGEATPLWWAAGPSKKSGFGKSMAVGDVNADGDPDVLVGAPGDKLGVLKGVGSVTVLSGSDGTVLQRHYGLFPKAGLGNSVAVGDVDGDGVADLVSGAAKDDNPQPLLVDAGSVTVWRGVDNSLLGRVYGTAKRDYCGTSVAAGDLNGDGVAEVLAGVPGRDEVDGGLKKDAGMLRVLAREAFTW